MRTWSGISAPVTWTPLPRPSEHVKVLVTGASGFVGRHLVRELLQEDSAEIVAGSLDGVPAPGLESSLEWVPMDVTSGDSVRSAVASCRPDRVFHLAGQSSVGQSFDAPLETWEINATGTLRLLDALQRECGTAPRLLVISSAEVYGRVPEEEQPIHESDPRGPLTPYGSSKAAAELCALQFGEVGVVDSVIARSFNHIGPGQDSRFVLPSIARQLVKMGRGEAEPVLKVGNLDVRRDFLDVRDVVRAYVWLMEKGASGEMYNVCSGEDHSLRAIIEYMVKLSETGARIEEDAGRIRPADIPLLVGDPSRLRALGWEARIPLDQSLRDVLADAADD
jgi:GDP-4-dehydro-6-deoxy-D-mannose reductase